MNTQTKEIMIECTKASDETRMSFPEVVRALKAVGVERYHSDLARSERTYYLPNGESEITVTHRVMAEPAKAFSPEAVKDALIAIQQQKISYPEFCERIAGAGCVEYIVSLSGNRTTYIGRAGDTYVEHFPANL